MLSARPTLDRVRRRGVTLVVALAGCALAPSAALAAPGPDYFGTNIQPMVKLQVVPPDRWDSYILRQAADGLGRARGDGAWSWAEPTAPSGGTHTYEWNPANRPHQSLDRVVALLAARGVRWVPVLATAPGWAMSSGNYLSPAHYDDFIAFAGAFAARYGSLGTFWLEHPELPRLPVTDYEVWTEANSANFWTRKADAPEYAKVLIPLAAAVRAKDPAARILASIGWQGVDSYMRALYAQGVKGSIDAIGFHPYAPGAPAIVDLTVRMRRVLREVGDGDLPIDVTETGQPRAPSGPGASHSYAGLVSDQARAATHALAGEALAHSDCGVTDYLMYANVGSETGREPGAEGYMGIYRVDQAVANATGAAIAAAADRWRKAPAGGLHLCGGGATADAALLPLGLTATRDGGCVTTTTTYDGNPLEAAKVVVNAPDPAASGETDAFGATRPCVTGTWSTRSFDVYAVVNGIARSAILRCPAGGSTCARVVPPPSAGGGAAAGTDGTPPAPDTSAPDPSALPVSTSTRRCRYRLTTALLSRGRRSVRMKARLTCTGGRARPRLRFSVRVKRRGSKRWGTARRVTLKPGRTTRLTVRRRLKVGDRVMLVSPTNRKARTPRVQKTLRVKAKSTKRARKRTTTKRRSA